MDKITDENIQFILETNENILIKYTADWCNPCKTLTPILEKLQEDEKNILIMEADIINNGESSKKYSVKNIPTCIFIKNGIEKGRFIGTKTTKQIKEFLKEYNG